MQYNVLLMDALFKLLLVHIKTYWKFLKFASQSLSKDFPQLIKEEMQKTYSILCIRDRLPYLW